MFLESVRVYINVVYIGIFIHITRQHKQGKTLHGKTGLHSRCFAQIAQQLLLLLKVRVLARGCDGSEAILGCVLFARIRLDFPYLVRTGKKNDLASLP
jgi:hypothetical protein